MVHTNIMFTCTLYTPYIPYAAHGCSQVAAKEQCPVCPGLSRAWCLAPVVGQSSLHWLRRILITVCRATHSSTTSIRYLAQQTLQCISCLALLLHPTWYNMVPCNHVQLENVICTPGCASFEIRTPHPQHPPVAEST